MIAAFTDAGEIVLFDSFVFFVVFPAAGRFCFHKFQRVREHELLFGKPRTVFLNASAAVLISS